MPSPSTPAKRAPRNPGSIPDTGAKGEGLRSSCLRVAGEHSKPPSVLEANSWHWSKMAKENLITKTKKCHLHLERPRGRLQGREGGFACEGPGHRIAVRMAFGRHEIERHRVLPPLAK